MKVVQLAKELKLPLQVVMDALSRMQARGEFEGFVEGDPDSDVKLTGHGVLVMKGLGELEE
jgi:Mn-dependent DtxR family transcriptional regulator